MGVASSLHVMLTRFFCQLECKLCKNEVKRAYCFSLFSVLKCSLLIFFTKGNEPVHEIPNNVVCATSKASDQPAHTRSLIKAFASRLSIL